MMRSFYEAVTDPHGSWEQTEDGRVTVTITPDVQYLAGDDGVEATIVDTYEVAIEPLLFGQMYLAIYKNGHPIANKVPVRPGGPREESENSR